MKNLKDRTILITGSTDGIGKLTAMQLAKEKAHVIVHGRDEQKVSAVVEELKNTSGNMNVEGYTSDFSSLADVKNLAEKMLIRYKNLDILINNAGAGYADPRYSSDGYELRFAVNYLAPFLLTNLLLPAVKNSAPSRIVNISSAGQHPLDFADIMMEKNFNPTRAYSQSKLALIMFTFDLAEELKNENVTVNTLHPGTYLDTNMVRKSGITPWANPESGAQAVFFLATSEKLENVTGKYFSITSEARADPQAYNEEARKKLREMTLHLLREFL